MCRRCGAGGAVGDFLALAAEARRPRHQPHHQGIRTSRTTRYLTWRAVHRGAGVAHGVAGEADLVVELGGGLGRIESDLELGPLVFLDAEMAAPCARPFDLEGHLAHEPVARRGEAAGERAVVVGRCFWRAISLPFGSWNTTVTARP